MLVRIAQTLLIVLFIVWSVAGSLRGSTVTEVERTSIINFLNLFGVLLTAIATVAIAAFTGTLWRATDKLREAGERQGELTRILERAYISVAPLGISPFISEDQINLREIVGHVSFVNVGRLPARNASILQASLTWSERLWEKKDVEFKELPSMNFVIPPGTEMPLGTNPYPSDHIGDKGYFYVWGEIRYTDGFDEPRFTKFCHRYPCQPFELAPDGSKSIDAKHARYHEHGNDAD
jgi:hypothetical protein